MSKETKFRAWLKNQKQMVKVNAIFFGLELVEIEKKDKVYTGQHFEDIELLQYTGLKDKNGVEVFEGDILEQFGIRRVVKREMSCGSCCSQVIGFGASGELHTDFIRFDEEFEVIGNIYENKELLEDA